MKVQTQRAGNFPVKEQAPSATALQTKYVRAMAESLGVKPIAAEIFSAGLVASRTRFAHLDPSKDRSAMSPAEIQELEQIGRTLLKGTGRESLSFTVGCFALRASREEPGSKFLANLEDWVGMWNDGDTRRFQEIVSS
jgi:hypothetical protein